MATMHRGTALLFLVSTVLVLVLGPAAARHLKATCRVSGTVAPRTVHRGMYVSLLASSIGPLALPSSLTRILGSTTKENALLSFIIAGRFDSLSLYDLPTILADSTSATRLSTFVLAAKACGVTEVNAIGSAVSHWDLIKTYQAAHDGRFDGMVTEIEFWAAGGGDAVHAAFADFLAQVSYARALNVTAAPGAAPLPITAYIGWLDRDPATNATAEAAAIAAAVDRVFVHCYVRDPATAASYGSARIAALRAARPALPVWPIFSAEGATHQVYAEDLFMGDWLAAHSLTAAETIFASSGYAPGYQYYEYAFLKMYNVHN